MEKFHEDRVIVKCWKKWPIRDRPLTLSASQILFVAIFQLEHETHGKESVLQWSHSAKEI